MATAEPQGEGGEQPAERTPSTDDSTAPVTLGARVPPALIFRWAVAGSGGVLLVLLVASAVYTVRTLLLLILVALFVAVSLDPAIRWLVAKGVRRRWAVAIVVAALVVVAGLFVWSVVPPLVDQGRDLFTDLPGHLERLSEQSQVVGNLTDRYQVSDVLSALTREVPGALAGGAFGLVQRLLGGLVSGGIVLGLAIYFMADMPRLQGWLVDLFPSRRRTQVADVVEIVVDKVGGYMIGNIVVSVFAGLSSLVVLELLGVPFALPLAVFVAITDLIPTVGATIGAVGCLLVSVLAVGLWPASVILLLFFIAYQQVENYVIVPRVMRSAVGMPAVAVLVVALLGGTLFGLVGAIMAIPIAAAAKVVMSPMIEKTGAEG